MLYAGILRQQICKSAQQGAWDKPWPGQLPLKPPHAGQQPLTHFECIPGCKDHSERRKGKSAPARNGSVCLREEERQQVDGKDLVPRCRSCCACVGGDGCSMPAASALAIFCGFVGSMAWGGGRGRLGEMLGHGRDAQQRSGEPTAAPAQLPKAEHHSLKRPRRCSLSMRGCLWDWFGTGEQNWHQQPAAGIHNCSTHGSWVSGTGVWDGLLRLGAVPWQEPAHTHHSVPHPSRILLPFPPLFCSF